MTIEFDIQEGDYFTIEEIADKLNLLPGDIDYFIYGEKSLRLAVVSQLLPEFGEFYDLTCWDISQSYTQSDNTEDRTRRYEEKADSDNALTFPIGLGLTKQRDGVRSR